MALARVVTSGEMSAARAASNAMWLHSVISSAPEDRARKRATLTNTTLLHSSSQPSFERSRACSCRMTYMWPAAPAAGGCQCSRANARLHI
jgi:hypothetical protein